MVPSFKSGSLFVKNAKDEVMRLAWEPMVGEKVFVEGGEGARIRSLLPGDYSVTGYRINRRDDHGSEWTLSGLNASGVVSFTVATGKKTVIEINPAIHFGAKGMINEKKEFVVQAPIMGQHHAGVSMYKAGVRIPMGYTIKNRRGAVLEAGKMNYG